MHTNKQMMINRKYLTVFSLKYVFFVTVVMLLTVGFISLPKSEENQKVNPEELLRNAINPERYVSTDELADRIISKDPSLVLIDVRDGEDFKKYSIPGAKSIPLRKILDKDSDTYLNQDRFDVVLLSNDNFYADQAWILCNRLGYKNLHVLQGGINKWFNTIINPPEPTEGMPTTAFEQYSFRKAASMFFGVAYPKKIIEQPKPKKVVPVKKKKKMPIEGGC